MLHSENLDKKVKNEFNSQWPISRYLLYYSLSEWLFYPSSGSEEFLTGEKKLHSTAPSIGLNSQYVG